MPRLSETMGGLDATIVAASSCTPAVREPRGWPFGQKKSRAQADGQPDDGRDGYQDERAEYGVAHAATRRAGGSRQLHQERCRECGDTANGDVSNDEQEGQHGKNARKIHQRRHHPAGALPARPPRVAHRALVHWSRHSLEDVAPWGGDHRARPER